MVFVESCIKYIDPLIANKLLRFLFTLVLTAVAIGAIVQLGVYEGFFTKPSFFLKTLIFLTAITFIIYLYLYKVNKPDLFLQLYLLTMVVKLLAYCIYNFIMITRDKSAAISNVVFFMITYFIFTALEIGFLHFKITGRNKR